MADWYQGLEGSNNRRPAQASLDVGCGLEFRRGTVRSRLAATRRAASAHMTSSSGADDLGH
jgi:hypothetical protein